MIRFWELKGKVFFFCYLERVLIVELAEHSPIIIQNSSNPSSQKNLVVQLYDCTTIQGATFNMRGQLYHGHANAMALSSGQCTGLQVGQPRF